MRARTLFTALALALAAIAGCESDKGTFPANQMPQTYLSIISPDGMADTTDYRKILNWWGTDQDGKVTGYLIRWTGEWSPPAGTVYEYGGMAYSLTTATQDTFNIPVEGTFAAQTFTVRAVDDQGLVDSIGVTQGFQVTNNIPHIRWNPDFVLPDTTLAATSFSWNAADLDGRKTITDFRYWLDDDSLQARSVSDTVVSVRPEDFPDRVDGVHTIHVRGYDDARTPTQELLTHTWYVQWPQDQPYLLIRQYTAESQLDRWDRKVFQAILSDIAGGLEHVYVIDMNAGPDFATKEEVEPLFSLFESVAWLIGPYDVANDAKMVRNLKTAEMGMRSYIEGGGRVLLVGQSVVGTEGGLSSTFTKNDLGISTFYRKIATEPGDVTTTSLPLNSNEFVRFGNDASPDSLKVQRSCPAVDYFLDPVMPGSGRYWIAPGTLRRMIGRDTDPSQDSTAAYLGVVSGIAQGRITVVTTSYARLFPNPGTGEPLPQDIQEGIKLFREALVP
jgi:hypothetical protein